MIELHDLTVGYGGKPVLREVFLAFPPGQVTVLLGPNGCGKSTLMKTALGLLPRQGGEILYDGVDLNYLTTRQVARKAAYLPQSREIPSITVRRMVLHGRFPYLGYPRRYRAEDYETARKALEWVRAADLADRPVQELSGGQRQKVYLAMALAQDTETIFMDEPTTFLDVRHQLEVMQVARRMAAEGKAVAVVLHDLCLAMRTAHRIAVLADGRLQALDRPEAVYASGILPRIFGVSLSRTETDQGWQYYYDYDLRPAGQEVAEGGVL